MSEEDPLLFRNLYHVKPSATVSSFFFFIPPLIRRAETATPEYRVGTLRFAMFLVLITYVMQLGMLYVIGNFVVEERQEWVESVIAMSDIGDEVGCGNKEALCLHVDGQFNCGPKSVQLYGRWHLLDSNRDGVFSLAEATNKKQRDAMICRYGVDTLVFYKFLLNELTSNPLLTSKGLLHSNLTSGVGIHKSYFDWFKADAVMCAYGDENMCGNLFAKGVFDAPMTRPGVSLAVNDTTSAFTYCNDLLKEGGRCMNMLPSTYRVWRLETNQLCGAKEHNPYVYTNPSDDTDVRSVSRVDFSMRQEYHKTNDVAFKVFLWALMTIFYFTVLAELRETLRLAVWVAYFPARGLPGEEGYVPDEAGETQLKGIHKNHRTMCTILVGIKFFMIVVVAYAGTLFLFADTNVMNLLFDALSLVFIIQVDALVYETLVRQSAKDELESIQTMHVGDEKITAFYLSHNPPYRDFLWVLGLVFASAAVITYEFVDHIHPLQQALDCACIVEGKECFEATQYDRAWWNNYWLKELPACYDSFHRFMGHHHHHHHHLFY